MNPDGMVALLNYREDGTTPYFTFFKDGLKAEKLPLTRHGSESAKSTQKDTFSVSIPIRSKPPLDRTVSARCPVSLSPASPASPTSPVTVPAWSAHRITTIPAMRSSNGNGNAAEIEYQLAQMKMHDGHYEQFDPPRTYLLDSSPSVFPQDPHGQHRITSGTAPLTRPKMGSGTSIDLDYIAPTAPKPLRTLSNPQPYTHGAQLNQQPQSYQMLQRGHGDMSSSSSNSAASDGRRDFSPRLSPIARPTAGGVNADPNYSPISLRPTLDNSSPSLSGTTLYHHGGYSADPRQSPHLNATGNAYSKPRTSSTSSSSTASTIANATTTAGAGSKQQPFESLSPLSFNASDGSRNIWGAPDLTLAPSVFPTTAFAGALPYQRSSQPTVATQQQQQRRFDDMEAAFPSKLLFAGLDDPLPADTRPRAGSSSSSNSSARAAAAAAAAAAAYHQQFQNMLPPPALPATFRSASNSRSGYVDDFVDQYQQALGGGTVDPYLFSAAIGRRMGVHVSPGGFPSTGLATGVGGSNGGSGAYSPLSTPVAMGGLSMAGLLTSPNLVGSAGINNNNSAEGGESPHLPIVREIQTSKLRVDESRLTRDYFDHLTREARCIIAEISPGVEEVRMQEGVFEVVQEVTRRVFPEASLHHFGSTANGFSLANSDMDLCICLYSYDASKMSTAQCVEKIGHALKQAGMKDVKMLTRARVPIVKMRDPVTGIRCDVGFQNNLAIFNTRLLKTYAQIDPRFRELVFIVKFWSKRRSINEPYFGTLSSYCYVLMIIHLLQIRGVLPCLQRICPDGTPANAAPVHPTLTNQPGPGVPPVVEVDGADVYFYDDLNELGKHWQSTNAESLGELIVAFFKYYSAEFPYVHGVASVRAGRVISKEDKGWTKERQQELNRNGGVKDRFWLCVEDPFEVTHNIGRPVDKETLYEVRGEFIRASKCLCAGATGEFVLSKICEKQMNPPKKAGGGGGGGGGVGGGGNGSGQLLMGHQGMMMNMNGGMMMSGRKF
ncbi:hypothetical protein HK101_001771 [Irineochytrium annulatum]|nr:hypothetical protein HK101_001771 [Irineochytrium annulatum]